MTVCLAETGSKGKVPPRTGHEGPEGEQVYSCILSSTSALEGVGGQHHAPTALTPRKDPVPVVQEAGWTPEPVWMGARNLASTRIRSPDRLARSESRQAVGMANNALEVRPLKIYDVTSSGRACLGRFKYGENLYHLRTQLFLNTRLCRSRGSTVLGTWQ